jgi:hypothetical protein
VRAKLSGRTIGGRAIGPDESTYLAGRSGGQLGVALRMAEGDLFGLHQELADRLAGLTPAGAIDLSDWLEEQINTLARERVEREGVTDSQAKKEVACDLLSTAALVLSDAIRRGAGYESKSQPALVAAASTRLARANDEDRLARLGKAIDACRRADYLIAVRFVNPRLALDEVALSLGSLLGE